MTLPINPYVAGNPVGDSPAFVGRAARTQYLILFKQE
jgi:hypothetical protein